MGVSGFSCQWLIPVVVTLIAACSNEPSVTAGSADKVFQTGKIYTVNEKQPWVEAVAVKDGKFIKVGKTADVKALIDDDTKVVDLEGRFVMPGIIDLHAHPFITPWYGDMNLSLSAPDDADKILADLKAYAEANPDKEWILAGQWRLGVFPDNVPKKEWLDEIIPDRPVAVSDQDEHSACNPKRCRACACERSLRYPL